MEAVQQSATMGNEEHGPMLSYDEMLNQTQSMQAMSTGTRTFDFPYPHFAMIYIDQNGEIGLEVSASVAGFDNTIFTEDVRERFLRTVSLGTRPDSQSMSGSASHSINERRLVPESQMGFQANSGWCQTGMPNPRELIPCEWQSQHSKRQKRTSVPPSPTIKRSVLHVGEKDLLRQYYEKGFENFQQLNCRVIAKAFIKLVEPRKQVNHPYNGKKAALGSSTQRADPELTKPRWWPAGVTHKEPDHLIKPERIRLLVHILCELSDSHGITSEKLKEAGLDVRRQINPPERLRVLDEIYYVRQMEESFLKGEIDAETSIYVTETHLAEAPMEEVECDQNIDGSPRIPSPPAITVKEDPSSPEEDRSQNHPARDGGLSSMNSLRSGIMSARDERSLPCVEDAGQLQHSTDQDYILLGTPGSSVPNSRISSSASSISSFSSDADSSMASTSGPSAAPIIPEGSQFTGTSSTPGYFAQPFMVPTAGQSTNSGFWNHSPYAHTPSAYHHTY